MFNYYEFISRDLGPQDIFSFDMDDPNPTARRLVQSNVTGKLRRFSLKEKNFFFLNKKVVRNRWVFRMIGYLIVYIGQMKHMEESFHQEIMVRKN